MSSRKPAKHQQFFIALLIAFLLVPIPLICSAKGRPIPAILRVDQPDMRPNQKRLVSLDRELTLELIKLARFNIHFHQAANKRWVWRSWIYPILQEAGTGASFANTLIDLRQRANGLRNVDLIDQASQDRGLKSAIAGNAISGGASASELAQNLLVVAIAKHQGYSPKDSIAFVKKQLETIDALLLQREQLVAITAAGALHQTHELEGELLKQVRDELCLEFKRWSAHSRETMWRENTFYSIDTAQNFISLTGSVISRSAFTSPSLKGTAAITALVANSMASLNPPVKVAVGKCMRHYQRWHLDRVLPGTRPSPTKEIIAEWERANQQTHLDPEDANDNLHIKEAAFIATNAMRGERDLAGEQQRIEKLRQVAAQQAISGPIIGMASVARSLLITIGYYGYRDNPVISNRLAFAGRISQAAGQTYSLINTPATRINQSIYTHKLQKQGQLPSQILEKRLQRLDDLESQINTANKPVEP